MKSTEFCYWLQGLFELAKPTELSAEQTDLIKKHLDMVFIHEIDPSYPEAQKPALDAAHSGRPPFGGASGKAGDILLRC